MNRKEPTQEEIDNALHRAYSLILTWPKREDNDGKQEAEMTDELKPCPFCGKDTPIENDEEEIEGLEFVERGSGTIPGEIYYDLNCNRCDVQFCVYGVKPGVIKWWNTRPIEDALRAELAAAKAENHWVSVDIRLPEVHGPYLVYRRKSILKVLFWPAIPEYWASDGITHWMPLPSPPAE